ncbi:SDR family oxidoreductase [Desulforhopalus singaporensis]|uniref:Nucleoside-diphosphate-sugar epimerase n=1 Tax=Desulforhopalus singaporensis TaxID=91360 RepID=A0A1H0PU59_9BACT|nr:SDR family oxidoreductase [Desulforhopalus singaporensis]SDP08643.1 Nucleoside-diphosphate-sugar epimerase [Desulforhopalus singaporensis]
MSETVLVTGGTGVVGRPLVDRLVRSGKHVVVLSRGRTGCGRNLLPNAESLSGDVSLPDLGIGSSAYEKLCRTVRTVYHLAARTDFKGRDVHDYQLVNIDGVRHMHAFALRAQAHLHHVSTAFVCGGQHGLVQEDDPADSDTAFRNGYEKSKFLAEQYLLRQAKQHGTRLTIYRPSIILERNPNPASVKRFGPFVFLDAIFRILVSPAYQNRSNKPIRVAGNKHCHLPFIFDDDVAEALFRISQRQEQDDSGLIYHLVCKKSFANGALEDICNRAFGGNVATMVDVASFRELPRSRVEEILARKTAMYAPYLDLTVEFDRQRLDEMMGRDFCVEVTEDELLQAFSLFLAAKGKKTVQTGDSDGIERYFSEFLPAIIGRRLVPNLMSLSCVFWIQVDGVACRSLVVRDGCLEEIKVGRRGEFGYSVSPHVFMEVICGRLSPQQGFFDGNITLEGSNIDALKTAVALEEFFHKRPFGSLEEKLI